MVCRDLGLENIKRRAWPRIDFQKPEAVIGYEKIETVKADQGNGGAKSTNRGRQGLLDRRRDRRRARGAREAERPSLLLSRPLFAQSDNGAARAIGDNQRGHGATVDAPLVISPLIRAGPLLQQIEYGRRRSRRFGEPAIATQRQAAPASFRDEESRIGDNIRRKSIGAFRRATIAAGLPNSRQRRAIASMISGRSSNPPP